MPELYDIHSHAGEQLNDLYNEPEVFPRKRSVEQLIMEYGDRIDKIVACPMPGTVFFNYEEISQQQIGEQRGRYPYDLENRALIEAVDQHDPEGKVLPFACIHPRIMVAEQLDGLQGLMRKNRLVGMKFHTLDTNSGLEDFFSNPEITHFCKQMNLPILIHSANFNNVENCNDIFRWSRINDDLRVCIAHLMNFSSKFFQDLSRFEGSNLYADMSPFLGLCKMAEHFKDQMDSLDLPFGNPAEVLQALVTRYGPRIIWGSDEPFGKFKLNDNEYVDYLLEDELNFLFSLDDQVRTQIASTNSKRFIGTPETS